MKMEIRFGFPLRAFGESVWNCQKSHETFVLFSLPLLLLLLFYALLRTTSGRGRKLLLVALLQTLCICQADSPTGSLVLPQLCPFSFGNTHLKCTFVFPTRLFFPSVSFAPFLLDVYYSLVVELNKVLSCGAFVVLTFECFWHLCKFVLISYCTQQIDVCSNSIHTMWNARWGTAQSSATLGEFAIWIVGKAISLFCQAIHWKVSSGKHSAHSPHSPLWLSTKAFIVLWNLFYSHFIFLGGFSRAFFLSLFSISLHFPLCCSYSRWRNAKIMIKMTVCLLLLRILLFIWKLCEKSRARQTKRESERDKGHRLCGAFE